MARETDRQVAGLSQIEHSGAVAREVDCQAVPTQDEHGSVGSDTATPGADCARPGLPDGAGRVKENVGNVVVATPGIDCTRSGSPKGDSRMDDGVISAATSGADCTEPGLTQMKSRVEKDDVVECDVAATQGTDCRRSGSSHQESRGDISVDRSG